jgi:hypothetical protein
LEVLFNEMQEMKEKVENFENWLDPNTFFWNNCHVNVCFFLFLVKYKFWSVL